MPLGVLIYRDDHRRERTADALRRVAAAPNPADADAAISLFIDIAELEAAIVDALSTERDGLDPIACAMREATLAAACDVRLPDGRTICEARRAGGEGADGVTTVRAAIAFVSRQAVPDTIAMRVSEGYAYYALFPETYALSAQRFWSTTQPARVAVIGIRSIGTGLSAIVAETLRACACETWSCTVRPHGHPFDRHLALREDLEKAWRSQAARGAVFAIVDEGPGLSGSSFASVVRALYALGVADDRIVLFPSWDPDPERLKSETARLLWRRHARWCTDARAAGLTPERLCGVDGDTIDFSAGRWRGTVLGATHEWPAAHPQHERWKVAIPSRGRVIRFAGLGRYGTVARDRAERLFDLEAGVQPGALTHGFLELPFVSGVPLATCRDPTDAAAIGRYIATAARAFPADRAADTASLAHVIETNVNELLGEAAARHVRQPCEHPPRDLPAAYIDGRMLAHEWIQSEVNRSPAEGRGRAWLVKVDALDHARDHFYPGAQSPAWDLAAAAEELEMDAAMEAAMLDAFHRVSPDREAIGALAFYKLAYAAFRTGYVAVAAESLAGSDEGHRFARLLERWRRQLQSAVDDS